MANFNKSNWVQTAGAEKATQYLPAATGGINAPTVAANSTTVITSTIRFQFKGNGQMEISVPPSTTALATGLSLGEATLLAPASGSYAGGNHPRVQFKVVNSTATGITAGSTDVILVQY